MIKHITHNESHKLINERKGLFQYRESVHKDYGKAYIGSADGVDYVEVGENDCERCKGTRAK